jgi:DNA-directed RNA polymerase specialized sigma subunit
MSKTKLCELIDEHVIGFKAERNKLIIKRRFCDGLTFEELSEEFDISVNQVKRIVYNGIAEILKKASGFT